MAVSERSQPAGLSPRAGLCSWLGGVRGGFFGSQLRLSKAETFLHFRLAEFQVPLDTESRSYNRPKLSVDLSTVSSGLYITRLRVKNVRPVSPVERLPISTGNLSRGIMVWRFWVSFISVVCRAESAFICGYRSKGGNGGFSIINTCKYKFIKII